MFSRHTHGAIFSNRLVDTPKYQKTCWTPFKDTSRAEREQNMAAIGRK